MKNATSKSPGQMTWDRLKKNKPALLGGLFIAICMLVALLGYLLTTDQSPAANNQMVDIQLKSPGYEIDILKIRKNREVPKATFLSKMMFGVESEFITIPMKSYEIKNDSIHFLRPDNSILESESLINVSFPVNPDRLELFKTENEISFSDAFGNSQKTTHAELISKVKHQIVDQKFWLGTDVFGRDLLSRLLIGLRISLLVGLIAVLISLTIGITIGAIGGYFGGRVDDVVMLLINTVWSIPTLLLVFAIVLTLGKGVSNIFIAVGLTMWVEVARIVRGQVFSYRKMAFIEAAQSMGYGHSRIIFQHILPNILGPILVIAAANFATAILIEAGLSYLGFGIEPPQPSWGTMLNENYGYALSGKPLIALVPASAILLLVLSFNLLGNGLRDALDVKKD